MFIKFGRPEHIINCYEEEYLYFSTMQSFRSHEKDEFGQNDPKEGNLLTRQYSHLTTINAKGEETHWDKVLKNFSVQLNEYPAKIPGNICSLYAIVGLIVNEEYLIDKRMFSKGSIVLLIHDGSKFIDMLDESLSILGQGYTSCLVNYYDPTMYDGEITFFNKDIKYEYQMEYRILIKTTGEKSLKVSIPGLKSVSEVVDFKSANSLLIEG